MEIKLQILFRDFSKCLLISFPFYSTNATNQKAFDISLNRKLFLINIKPGE